MSCSVRVHYQTDHMQGWHHSPPDNIDLSEIGAEFSKEGEWFSRLMKEAMWLLLKET